MRPASLSAAAAAAAACTSVGELGGGGSCACACVCLLSASAPGCCNGVGVHPASRTSARTQLFIPWLCLLPVSLASHRRVAIRAYVHTRPAKETQLRMTTRQASHAGSWYTSSKTQLNSSLDGWLQAVDPALIPPRGISAAEVTENGDSQWNSRERTKEQAEKLALPVDDCKAVIGP